MDVVVVVDDDCVGVCVFSTDPVPDSDSDAVGAVSDTVAVAAWLSVVDSDANNPVLWIIEPSFRERINVEWTPGREVRWERRAVTCWGTCCYIKRRDI